MDWSNQYTTGTQTRSTERQNVRVAPDGSTATRTVYTPYGRRIRAGYTKNPFIAPGLRRSGGYDRRVKISAGVTPTVRTNTTGHRATIWPERIPYMSDDLSPTPGWFWTNSFNRANVECMNRLVEGKVQAMNDLLEARRTLDMLSEATRSAANALIAFRRGHFKAAMRHLLGPGNHPVSRKIADRWLQFVYGWKPLASSIHDYQELLKAKTDTRKILRASREIKDGFDQKWSDAKATGYYHTANGQVSGRASVKVILYAEVSLQYVQAAKTWGVSNPASIAWEAAPYSFVVDWLIPVGNVIEAWGGRAGLSFLTGSRTNYWNGSGEVSLVAVSVDNSWNSGSVSQMSKVRLNHKEVVRTRLTAFPYPIPYFKNPFSTTHVASALALLRQLR